MAVAPDGAHLYTSYTDPDGATRVDEYVIDGTDIDAGSRRQVFGLPQPFTNHNGGNIVFGPDDLLYLGLGDGGSAGDPDENGQDTSTLLGSMIRIDPAPQGDRTLRGPQRQPVHRRRRSHRDLALRRPQSLALLLRPRHRRPVDRRRRPGRRRRGRSAPGRERHGRGQGRQPRLEPGGGHPRVRRVGAPRPRAPRLRVRPRRRQLLGHRRLRLPGRGDPRPRRGLPVRRLLRLGAAGPARVRPAAMSTSAASASVPSRARSCRSARTPRASSTCSAAQATSAASSLADHRPTDRAPRGGDRQGRVRPAVRSQRVPGTPPCRTANAALV